MALQLALITQITLSMEPSENYRSRPLHKVEFHFDNISTSRIIVNPKAARYPGIFLLCRRDHSDPPFLIGLELDQMNWLLMNAFDKANRVDIAARLGEILSHPQPWGELLLRSTSGDGLNLNAVNFHTRLRRFALEGLHDEAPLHFFEAMKMEKE